MYVREVREAEPRRYCMNELAYGTLLIYSSVQQAFQWSF
jgi:hypothetical protein